MNLVLICSDTFRQDYVGAYGNDWIQTPHLDALARDGTLFTEAYGEGLPTLPARRVMLTGRKIFPFYHHPQHSDLVQIEGWHPLYYEDVTLAEHLKENGYVTAFVTDVYHMMKPGKNFHRGFDCWRWVRGVEDDKFAIRDVRQVADMFAEATRGQSWAKGGSHWIVQHLMNRKDWKTEADSLVARVMTEAADWLKAYTLEAPFFLYLDCFDPHEPWDPPNEYGSLYYPGFDGFSAAIPPGSRKELSDDEFAEVKAAYAGEVTMVDRWIGHVVDTLTELDLMKDTLIVFTSDHGTMMGEQDEIHKGADRLRHQCTRVPLLFRHPGGEGAGRKVGGLVQHQDIMPTALSLLGLPCPDRVQGEDLWPMVTGDAPSSREIIISAFGKYASVRTPKWNLVVPWAPLPEGAAGRRELYDTESDPDELTNVIADHPDIVDELETYLKDYVNTHASETQGALGPDQIVRSEDQARI